MENLNNSIQFSEPFIVEEGVYGATFKKNNEDLFLRMELITASNTQSWKQFKTMNCYIANQQQRGVLSGLVNLAGEVNYPKYEDVKNVTGFTYEEYSTFTEKAINLKKKTDNKIVSILEANSVGSSHMLTELKLDKLNYIVYISKNPNFSIQNVPLTDKTMNLKNFIESYSDILISIGSDFSDKNSFNESTEDSFYSRGISRNPYWVFEEKYSGLSMLLHGFTGVIADKFFPKKKCLRVYPVGSMQWIIKNNLLPGEGYVELSAGYIVLNNLKVKEMDITALEITKKSPEFGMNYISVSALKRIYESNK
jgi:hypothetical protein